MALQLILQSFNFKPFKKRACLFLILLFLFQQTGFSQFPFFDWARQIDRRQGTEATYNMDVDSDGNIYMAGGYTWGIDLDPGPGVFNLPGIQTDNMYLVKLSPSGNFIWGKRIGGTRFTIVRNLQVDETGNISISGMFSGTTDFDPGPGLHEVTASFSMNPENHDIFILKLDSDGNFKWVFTAGNLNTDVGFSVTADAAGNTYATGNITGEVDFDPGPAQAMLGSNGLTTAFITKIDNLGNLVWAKEFRSNSTSYGRCIQVDQVGNIYVSGDFDGATDFDPGPSVVTMNSPVNNQAPFLTKLDAAGNLIWAKMECGTWFVVSDLQQIFSFLRSSGMQASLVKYDIDGNIIWNKLMGGRPSTWPGGNAPIALGAGNNIFITGEFNFTRDFDAGPATYNMTCYNASFNVDVFICRFDVDGNFIWARQIGGFSEEHPTSIAIGATGAIYTTGIFNLTVDFDPGPGVFEMTAYSGGGTYIHKMQPCLGATYQTLNINSCTAYTLNNQTYTQSGTYFQSLLNAAGCDSLISLNLVIESSTTDITTTACDSLRWNGDLITASGLYTHTYTSANGCDSLVRLHLTINNSSGSIISQSICEGTTYEGYGVSGTYTDHFTAANGCDSTRILNLLVIPRKYTSINMSICGGEAYEGYSNSGIYMDTLTGAEGCDSIRTLSLTVNATYNFTIEKSICKGENYLGHTTSGSYTDHFQTVTGCDSVQTTVLSVIDKPKPNLGSDTAMCTQDSIILMPGRGDTYLWQDGSVNSFLVVHSPGRYRVTVSNICGATTDEIIVGNGPCLSYFPSAFTPNDDGLNDRFKILNPRGISNYHLVIYNRWGEIVFQTMNPSDGWDGKYKGLSLDVGVFVWQCSFNKNGKNYKYKGVVSLLR